MDLLGRRVRVYRNLHTGNFSVQAKINGRWKVVDRVEEILLSSVEFRVQEGGRDRVRRDGVKNVHARVVGTVVSEISDNDFQNVRIRYNPYETDSFETVDGDPIFESEFALLKDNQVWV